MVCPPALSVACVPFAKVGHAPLATGRSGGGDPASAEAPPLLDPLEEPLLEPLDPPLPDPLEDPLDDPLDPPELLEALPASAPPEPLPDPASRPVSVDDDELPHPAATAIPSTPRPSRLRMAAEACARRPTRRN